MKKIGTFAGFASFALLLFVLTLWPSGLMSAKTSEVSRLHVTVTVPVAPAPTGACAGTFAHCVTLGWTAPTTDVNGNPLTGTLSYDVYRSTTSGTGYAKITSSPIAATTYEDDAVTGGVTYFYVMVAYQTPPGGSTSAASANSTQISATGLPVPPPNPPTALQAVSH